MAFTNKTNQNRVTKILETLDLIEKSARSNQASQEEMDQLLAPLHERFGLVPSAEPEPEPEPKGRVGASAPPWASVMDMAREAPLKDLTRALGIFMNRLDEEVEF